MIDWPALITAISLLAGALGLNEFIKGFIHKRTGAAQEEKSKNQSLMRENAKKDAYIQILQTRVRKQQEYSSMLRRMLVENGVPYAALPEWPKENETE